MNRPILNGFIFVPWISRELLTFMGGLGGGWEGLQRVEVGQFYF